MVKVKNVRPGILVIADAGLRLAPGETAEVETLSPQTERAIASGRLARVGVSNGAPAAKPSPEPNVSQDSTPDTNTQEREERDSVKSKPHPADKRRAGMDAMKKRLSEVDGGTQ